MSIDEVELVAGLVALLTQERTRNIQQLVIVRAVRRVASQAAFLGRRVLPEERAAFFGVAAIAHIIDALFFQQRRGDGTVRVVTIHAAHFAFEYGHVRTLPELCALLFVASQACLGDTACSQRRVSGEFGHWIMAITAAELVAGVCRTSPVQTIAAFVATQALGGLHLDWRAPFSGIADQEVAVLRVFDVKRAGAVTRLANRFFNIVLRIFTERLGVERMTEALVLGIVTSGTRLLAHVSRGELRRCGSQHRRGRSRLSGRYA